MIWNSLCDTCEKNRWCEEEDKDTITTCNSYISELKKYYKDGKKDDRTGDRNHQ